MLPEQVVECLDSESIQGGVPFRGQQAKRAPAIGVEPGQDCLERARDALPGFIGWLGWTSHYFPTLNCQTLAYGEIRRKQLKPKFGFAC
jgi:hypothetical protein